jgi:transcriptional regulator with XRE-family HTH domain
MSEEWTDMDPCPSCEGDKACKWCGGEGWIESDISGKLETAKIAFGTDLPKYRREFPLGRLVMVGEKGPELLIRERTTISPDGTLSNWVSISPTFLEPPRTIPETGHSRDDVELAYSKGWCDRVAMTPKTSEEFYNETYPNGPKPADEGSDVLDRLIKKVKKMTPEEYIALHDSCHPVSSTSPGDGLERFDNIKDLPILIKSAIKNRGIKQKDLAEKLGISKGAVSQIFSNDRSQGLKRLFEISSMLNIEFYVRTSTTPKRDMNLDERIKWWGSQDNPGSMEFQAALKDKAVGYNVPYEACSVESATHFRRSSSSIWLEMPKVDQE